MSPTTAIVVTISPPPPSPWSARNAISSAMFCASPQSAEPTRKITIADLEHDLAAVEVAELPVQRADDVDASRYAVTTHERCWIPPRSPTIVGSAVETIVWSSDASSRTSISAAKIRRTRGGAPSGSTVGADWSLMRASWRLGQRDASARL